MGEKLGGYEANLSPRVRQRREDDIGYEKGWQEAEAEIRPENVELAREILESLDLQELKKVFLEYLQKSGVAIEQSNETVLNDIFVHPIKNAAASYDAFTNQIVFSTTDEDFLEAKFAKAQRQPIHEEILLKMQLFFIHEVCHVFSRTRISTNDSPATESFLHQESGYRVSEGVMPEGSGGLTDVTSSFEAFNEGVTQRIAEEVFLEYHHRVGESSGARRFIDSFINEGTESLWRYSIYGNQIDSMCSAIAEYTGVPKETVWKSFERGYFEKPELFNSETTQLFRETFGEDFLSRYGKFGNQTSTEDLARFDGAHDFPHPKEYAANWLRYLGIPRE